MSLPIPSLDDRTFQELVDEAKRYVQRRCPEWTNHNVSDPGVTLIETFAWMTDLLLYRLNRVPERNYVKFLELLGVTLFPPAAARVEISFRLSSHQNVPTRIPAGTVVSTRRSATEQVVSFTTTDELVIVPATSRLVGTRSGDAEFVDHTSGLGIAPAFAVFTPEPPLIGDALYLGLDRPAPANIVLLQFVCEVGGHGIDPHRPPLRWEAWTSDGWVGCEVERDDTLGLNRSGAVELHVPAGHTASVQGGIPAAWLRCTVIDLADAAPYRSSPLVRSVTAATVGGDVAALHADQVPAEVLGGSDGTPGQRFPASRTPILINPEEPLTLEVGVPSDQAAPDESPTRWETWTAVPDFADSTPQSRHFAVEAGTGELRFGPVIRLEDGTLRYYGAIPPRGAVLRLPSYRTGGGGQGNVAARTVQVLRSSIPYVAAVYNRRPAIGGVDGETVTEAKERGPLELRNRNRAVTAEDYEHLAKRAAPELARVRSMPVTTGPDAGAVRLLVVPDVPDPAGPIPLAALRPPAVARERVERALEACRVIGVRVSIEPPSYLGIRTDARIRCRPDVDPVRLEAAALAALYRYFNPLTGGPDGDGWPFGRPVQVGEVYGVLAKVAGIDFVDDAVLFRVNPLNPAEVSPPQARIDLEPTHLVISVEHQIYLEVAPR